MSTLLNKMASRSFKGGAPLENCFYCDAQALSNPP